MSVAHATFRPQERPESKALVVMLSALQLGFLVLVWLLALLPVAVIALGLMVARGVRALNGKGGDAKTLSL